MLSFLHEYFAKQSGLTPASAYSLPDHVKQATANWTGGGGVTDHGALTGLLNNDHTQYALLAGAAFTGNISGPVATQATHYIRKDQVDAAIAALPVSATVVDVTKGLDQSVTNSTILVNDDTLKFTGTINSVWDVSLMLHLTGDVTANVGDARLSFTAPASSTIFGVAQGNGMGAGGDSGQHTTVAIDAFGLLIKVGTLGAAVKSGVLINFRITFGAAGDCTLQFAQENVSAIATTIKAGSNLVAVRKS